MYSSNFFASSSLFTKSLATCKVVEFTKSDYVKNTFGFLRNDFSQLMSSQDALSMERVLSKMREYQVNEPDNSKKSFEEIVALIRPRFIQSPAELDRFELYCIDNALDTYAKLKGLDEEQKEALAKAKREEVLRIARENGFVQPEVKPDVNVES